MSSEVAIKVESLSKCYQIYDQPRDRLKQFVLPRLQRLVGVPHKQHFREFWALKDVSFEVMKGETVGIIGRNGSGKSTLLQLICGTLSPTSGAVATHGRIAALLELGSGFNPEFTGRENVYMNAMVLGLSKDEIDARFDNIATFADIGEFIEQPVKTYSSGMLIRLAFAVAIQSSPDLLVIDEALAVGDVFFQQKCFERIRNLKNSGVTILFVSHDITSVQLLCDRALLLSEGEILQSGSPADVANHYVRVNSSQEHEENPQKLCEYIDPKESETLPSEFRYGNGRASILDFGLRDPSSMERVEVVTSDTLIEVFVRVVFRDQCINPVVGFYIKDKRGVEFYSGNTHYLNMPIGIKNQGDEIEVSFLQKIRFAPGEYTLSYGVSDFIDGVSQPLDRRYEAMKFSIVSNSTIIGLFDLQSKVAVRVM